MLTSGSLILTKNKLLQYFQAYTCRVISIYIVIGRPYYLQRKSFARLKLPKLDGFSNQLGHPYRATRSRAVYQAE